MKKTIAALLVTILASAGYVVLDKTAADKIDRLESQVSVQQEVIDRYGEPLDLMEMHTGCTIPCYPEVGAVVQAYVLDLSRTTTRAGRAETTTMTDHIFDEPAIPLRETTTRAPETTTTTTTTEPYSVPTGTTYAPTTTKNHVHAQQDDGPTRTAPTAHTVTVTTCETTMEPPTTTAPPIYTTAEPPTTKPDPTFRPPFETYTTVRYVPYDSDMDYYYHLRADVTIRQFRCEMIGKTLTGLPKFAITLTGKTGREYAGRTMRVLFGDDLDMHQSAETVIRPDGTFTVSTEVALARASVIPLVQLRID